jgi:hypothetical protein
MRAGGSRPRVVPLGTVLALCLGAAVLSGCGGGAGGTTGPGAPAAGAGTDRTTPGAGGPTGPTGGDADAACRAQWGGLADDLHGRDTRPDPSDLAARWAPVVAAAEHYRQAARADDCVGAGSPLAQAQDTVSRIEDLSSQLRELDIAHRAAPLTLAASVYLHGRVPRSQHGDRPPSRAQVRRALAVLRAQTAASVLDMQDGWEEAGAVDLADRAAVRRTVADLRFLAGDSAPFQACVAALDVLVRAAAAGAS